MAWKEIVVDEETGGADFFRFDAIGKKLAGRFVSYAQEKGNFERPDNNYVFRTAQQGNVKVSAPVKLHQALQKAELKPNYAVMMEYVRDVAPTTAGHSPTKIFKVMVDTDLTPRAAAPAAAAPAPKPQPPPILAAPAQPSEFDDIPM